MNGRSKSEKIVRDIKRHTRRKYSSEDKIRIVLEGLRGETSIAELCRREGLNPNVYYRWSKDFLEAGKKRLEGDTVREANSDQVKALREENSQLKQGIADYADFRGLGMLFNPYFKILSSTLKNFTWFNIFLLN